MRQIRIKSALCHIEKISQYCQDDILKKIVHFNQDGPMKQYKYLIHPLINHFNINQIEIIFNLKIMEMDISMNFDSYNNNYL